MSNARRAASARRVIAVKATRKKENEREREREGEAPARVATFRDPPDGRASRLIDARYDQSLDRFRECRRVCDAIFLFHSSALARVTTPR